MEVKTETEQEGKDDKWSVCGKRDIEGGKHKL